MTEHIITARPVGPSAATLHEADPTQTPDDRILWALAREIGTAGQLLMGEDIEVPFKFWLPTQQAAPLYAARVAVRWNEARAREHTRVHCREALAVVRHEMSYRELEPSQQSRINRDVDTVINTFAGRMTDRSFLYLGHDQRAALMPERKAVQS